MRMSFAWPLGRLGILGGGQLGKMTLQAASALHIPVSILSPSGDCAAAPYTDSLTVGDYRDPDAIRSFATGVDLLTIEIEAVNTASLQTISSMLPVKPSPEAIAIIQDKGRQKEFYQAHGIPTSDFVFINSPDDLKLYPDWFPAVQKMREAGYDGQGVRLLRSPDDPAAFPGRSILERKAAVIRELSVVVVRSASGIMVFPPVEMAFDPERNILSHLTTITNASPAILNEAIRIAIAATEAFGIEGVLAVEMFECEDGRVLVNEVAPRPHNSGHHTIEASDISQYQAHIRAIWNLPLPENRHRPAAMVNLLGTGAGESYPVPLRKLMAIPGAHVHWYGKKGNAAFRKLGHVSIAGSNPEEVAAGLGRVKAVLNEHNS